MAKNVIINGAIYNSVPYVKIPQTDGKEASFYDTSDATVQAKDTLQGKKTYGVNGAINGSMADNGDVSSTITSKSSITIPEGYTSGGTISIADTDKLISANIKKGITILGVSGSNMVLDTTISSGGATSDSLLKGYKAFVNGEEINGNATVPTITQDTSTHVLTIK